MVSVILLVLSIFLLIFSLIFACCSKKMSIDTLAFLGAIIPSLSLLILIFQVLNFSYTQNKQLKEEILKELELVKINKEIIGKNK